MDLVIVLIFGTKFTQDHKLLRHGKLKITTAKMGEGKKRELKKEERKR